MPDLPNTDVEVAPKRRFLDRKSSTPTLVAVGTCFEGDFSCPGDLSVAGEVVGNGRISGMLTLSDTSRWHGSVTCADALVAGKFAGELLVNGKLEIRASAHISGRIFAAQIAVAEGAVIEAEIATSSGAPIERFAEKRDD
jgi:cytoskeletal protein CcmA (bactofilin family)